MYARNAANAYATLGVHTGVMSASPHQLIVMLFDGARSAIARAKFLMSTGHVAAKGDAISKAIDIVENGLRAVLDHEAGGEIAANLEQLYEYMARRLMLANIRNDVALLDEVDGLLEGLASAWSEAGQANDAGQAQVDVQRAAMGA
ncbi:flagellar export chaperone FliS [Cupriavidus respiraculi]|uniref:flagellar export chaperone FliS n=1 Tax=Cupriavidus respiraculi TaxID=195930 RepID=UPI001C93DD6D|nr:flagellar export chaperone FliS [Cupriavidus respiraculi]MBY4947391.1 flagellar export chaperone FliS [Cupriavidus respiraculi]